MGGISNIDEGDAADHIVNICGFVCFCNFILKTLNPFVMTRFWT